MTQRNYECKRILTGYTSLYYSLLNRNWYASACVSIILTLSACHPTIKESPILLFNGKGSSVNDVHAIESILSSNRFDYTLINSVQLDEIDTVQLMKYKLLIIPGGNFIDMGKNLKVETTQKVSRAVYCGLNYFGICAGAFLAGNTKINSFNITHDVQFKFYSAEDNGIRKAALPIKNADGSIIDQYWEDGPALNGWGDVVSKYPDSTAATVQGRYGIGGIVLTGLHPEAPLSWRKDFTFLTTIEKSHEYAGNLIKAALENKKLAHF